MLLVLIITELIVVLHTHNIMGSCLNTTRIVVLIIYILIIINNNIVGPNLQCGQDIVVLVGCSIDQHLLLHYF